jgi:predicted RNA binding protein YcfA (HicA-like mRNA interferase family)
MGKRFKNSEEAIKELKKQGWKEKKGKKHTGFTHPLFNGKLPVPRKHKYLGNEVEASILKAMEEVESRIKEQERR